MMLLAGCAIQAPPPAPQIARPVEVRPLPYKGRLVEGDASELPPAIAKSLSKEAPLTFTYREELKHDESHTPMIKSAWNPATYAGAPLGKYEVTAFGTLTIFDGNKVVGDYTAEAHVSKSYNVYDEPKHSEVERAAREAVRERIDEKLYVDAARVAHAIVTE